MSEDGAPPSGSPSAVVRCVHIVNKRGLHARAAAKFVEAATFFPADIRVEKDGEVVSGRSIMGLLMLAASKGSSIRISASGREASDAVDTLAALVANKFDEGE